MPFPWSKKVVRVLPIAPPPTPEPVEEPQTIILPTIDYYHAPPAAAPAPAAAIFDSEVDLPVVDDKISDIEHKHGEQVADAREEDDEAHEEQGIVQEGGWSEEGDHGSQEDVEEARWR